MFMTRDIHKMCRQSCKFINVTKLKFNQALRDDEQEQGIQYIQQNLQIVRKYKLTSNQPQQQMNGYSQYQQDQRQGYLYLCMSEILFECNVYQEICCKQICIVREYMNAQQPCEYVEMQM
ncbi:hypothetical protein pb186bvf_020498 [Paramecium bursaria]